MTNCKNVRHEKKPAINRFGNNIQPNNWPQKVIFEFLRECGENGRKKKP